MAIVRDEVYAALFERLRTALGAPGSGKVSFFTRRHIASTEAKVQPALVMVASSQPREQQLGTAPVHQLEAEVLLYAKTSGVESPDTWINGVLDELEAALEWQVGEPRGPGEAWHTTLGGTCLWARIAEPVEIEPGIGTGQAIVSVVVELVVADTAPRA